MQSKHNLFKYSLKEATINLISPIIFLFIHNHLTLRKWCYTPLQHDFALDLLFRHLTSIFELHENQNIYINWYDYDHCVWCVELSKLSW
jgi:hypothetical protein